MERSLKQGKHLGWWEIKGLYLLMTRVVRSWSMGSGTTCKKNCYCLIYCNPFVMSCFRAHLCSPWLTCSMSRSDGAKESCDYSLLMSLCSCNATSYERRNTVIISLAWHLQTIQWFSVATIIVLANWR